MRDSILRIVDSQGRINIPKDLLELAYLTDTKIALCKGETSKAVRLCALNDLKNKKVLAIVKMDNKGRFAYPKELLEEYEQIFDIYYLNGYIYIEGD